MGDPLAVLAKAAEGRDSLDEEEMSNLMQKIVKEQEINEQSENEIIQLRIELDNVRKETGEGLCKIAQDVSVSCNIAQVIMVT